MAKCWQAESQFPTNTGGLWKRLGERRAEGLHLEAPVMEPCYSQSDQSHGGLSALGASMGSRLPTGVAPGTAEFRVPSSGRLPVLILMALRICTLLVTKVVWDEVDGTHSPNPFTRGFPWQYMAAVRAHFLKSSWGRQQSAIFGELTHYCHYPKGI